MAKIRTEIKVPDGKYCRVCEYCKYIANDYAICTLFDNTTILQEQDRLPERCDKCKQLEVEE